MSRGNAPSHRRLAPDEEGDGSLGSLWHPKNIHSGMGRIIWAPPDLYREGSWVLPGGHRTTDEYLARRAAEYIDRICRDHYQPASPLAFA